MGHPAHKKDDGVGLVPTMGGMDGHLGWRGEGITDIPTYLPTKGFVWRDEEGRWW